MSAGPIRHVVELVPVVNAVSGPVNTAWWRMELFRPWWGPAAFRLWARCASGRWRVFRGWEWCGGAAIGSEP